MNLTIPLDPRTKKNSMQKAKNGGLIQSKAYLQYEKDCKWFVKRLKHPIDFRINVKAVYYTKIDYFNGKARIDLNNLHNALHDILVTYGVLADDNCTIVYTTDGSYVDHDKQNPRTEITITEV